ncbi:5-dehydro-2-deoxygluconokinase [Marinomonas sp. 2405UD68-3]|uniref:5-dehydro-2-deoxygluconokinase n=1 Tax=Marinomonas sp. 2405UD68-3 TaxID=3391835 RepID=UPI0039C9F414
MSSLSIPVNRALDVICLGRAGVDLYAHEENVDMEDVSGFDKHVGGSPANIAVALSKLGAKVGLISCVSDDSLGRYVCSYLKSLDVDLTGMKIDDTGSRTSLAITEMKADDCEVVIYRNNAADLSLSIEQIDKSYIAQAKMLLVSGTALSTSPSREAALSAIRYARETDTVVVLDVDYRAYSWRSPEDSSLYYQLAASLSDVVIGNREEFDVMELLYKNINEETARDDDKTAAHYLQGATQVVIMKAGEYGSKVYTQDGKKFEQGIFPVDVKKPFGAGDSFAGALMFFLLQGAALEESVKMGAASAAINVSRKSCTDAMPTRQELADFIHSYETA